MFVARGSILVSFAIDGETPASDMELADGTASCGGTRALSTMSHSAPTARRRPPRHQMAQRIWDVTTGGQISVL